MLQSSGLGLYSLGYNFTSCGMDWYSLPYTRAVVFTQGCWQEALTGGRIDSKAPCVRFTDSSLYLQRGSTYAVCGVSYFNNFFGQAGTVSIAVTETSKSLLSYASASVLQASPNGVSDASACLYLNPRPSGCAFDVASLCVECSSTDCSQATDAFCAGLNRQPCSILPNTCGACDECYLPADTDSGSGVAADGASGDAGSGDTASSSSSSSSSASGTTQCYAVSSGSVLPAPQLQPDGATNAIGPSGASGTSIRIKWRKPDCDPVSMFKLRLREQGGPWVDVFQGHPGGGFSRGEALTVSVDRPTSDTSGSNGGSASSGSGGSGARRAERHLCVVPLALCAPCVHMACTADGDWRAKTAKVAAVAAASPRPSHPTIHGWRRWGRWERWRRWERWERWRRWEISAWSSVVVRWRRWRRWSGARSSPVLWILRLWWGRWERYPPGPGRSVEAVRRWEAVERWERWEISAWSSVVVRWRRWRRWSGARSSPVLWILRLWWRRWERRSGARSSPVLWRRRLAAR